MLLYSRRNSVPHPLAKKLKPSCSFCNSLRQSLNPNSGIWEPILERFHLALEMERTAIGDDRDTHAPLAWKWGGLESGMLLEETA